MLFTMYSLS